MERSTLIFLGSREPDGTYVGSMIMLRNLSSKDIFSFLFLRNSVKMWILKPKIREEK